MRNSNLRDTGAIFQPIAIPTLWNKKFCSEAYNYTFFYEFQGQHWFDHSQQPNFSKIPQNKECKPLELAGFLL